MPKCMACSERARYGPIRNFATHCAKHKKIGMVPFSGVPCKEDMCSKQASFGFPGEKWEFCSTHAVEGMTNLKLNYCKHESKCKLAPCYGLPGHGKTHCFLHKSSEMLCFKYSLAQRQAGKVKYF